MHRIISRSDFTLDLWSWLGKIAPETETNLRPVQMHKLGLNVWYVLNAKGDITVYFDVTLWRFTPGYQLLESQSSRPEFEGTNIRVIDNISNIPFKTARSVVERALRPITPSARWVTGRIHPQKAEAIIPASERGWGN